jgi:hypothetical protein
MLLFAVLPSGIVFASVIVCQLLVFWSVRQRFSASKKYNANSTSTDARIQAVAMQSLSYVLAYTISLVPPSIVASMNLSGLNVADKKYFPLYVVLVFLWPLQGFLNFLVFIRQVYLRLRREEQNSRWQAFRVAAFAVEQSGGNGSCRLVSQRVGRRRPRAGVDKNEETDQNGLSAAED